MNGVNEMKAADVNDSAQIKSVLMNQVKMNAMNLANERNLENERNLVK
jgi:hypothetical protein